MKDLEEIKAFVFSGRATGTLESQTGRFTYRTTQAPVRDGQASAPYFVSVLAGPDNTSDYRYIGTVFADGLLHRTAKSTVSEGAESFRGFLWLTRRLAAIGRDGAPVELPDGVEWHHSGRCGKCGRKLTTPESVRTGLGPVCASRM